MFTVDASSLFAVGVLFDDVRRRCNCLLLVDVVCWRVVRCCCIVVCCSSLAVVVRLLLMYIYVICSRG